jgi:hypothetical protein
VKRLSRLAAGFGVAIMLTACGAGQAPAAPQLPRKTIPSGPPWTFDADPSAGLPQGALPLSGAWGVRADDSSPSPPNALCDTGAVEVSALSLGDTGYADVVLSARFKPMSGRTAQAGGLIFRVQDRDNYYVLVADALEKSVTLAKRVGGQSRDVADGAAEVAAGRWHDLRVEATGNRLRGFLDGQPVVEATDDSHRSGQVGLWTKADSTVCFDDVDVKTP